MILIGLGRRSEWNSSRTNRPPSSIELLPALSLVSHRHRGIYQLGMGNVTTTNALSQGTQKRMNACVCGERKKRRKEGEEDSFSRNRTL